MIAAGIDPKGADIKSVFAGAHDASILTIKTKQCDGGFAQESQVPTLIEKKQIAKCLRRLACVDGKTAIVLEEYLAPDAINHVEVALPHYHSLHALLTTMNHQPHRAAGHGTLDVVRVVFEYGETAFQ